MNTMDKRIFISLLATWMVLVPALHAELLIYVSPDGSDEGSGTIRAPFATMIKARDTIRELPTDLRRQNIRVFLRGGTYKIKETLVLEVEDGAPLGLRVSYEAFPGEQPILDSGAEISGWKKATTYPVGTPDAATLFKQLLSAASRARVAESPTPSA